MNKLSLIDYLLFDKKRPVMLIEIIINRLHDLAIKTREKFVLGSSDFFHLF